jgi:ATP-binding cassette subfamily B protein
MEVQKGLANLMEGRTTFVIAHRLSTVRNADRIVVLAENAVIEEGRHEELLRRGGEYARLHAMYLQGITEGIAT